jgi:hypothetical protein
MSKERIPKPQAIGWLVTIVAVPVLYVLSVPPLLTLGRHFYGVGPLKKWDTPRWVTWYCEPYVSFMEVTTVGKPLRAYYHWWRDIVDLPVR